VYVCRHCVKWCNGTVADKIKITGGALSNLEVTYKGYKLRPSIEFDQGRYVPRLTIIDTDGIERVYEVPGTAASTDDAFQAAIEYGMKEVDRLG
jgi:hypothetical protein